MFSPLVTTKSNGSNNQIVQFHKLSKLHKANAAILVIPAAPRMTILEKVTSFGAMACFKGSDP